MKFFKRIRTGSPYFIQRFGKLEPFDPRGIFNGAACFFCSSGPSMAEIPLAELQRPGILTLAVNNGAKVVRPDIWVSVDTPAKFLESVWRDPRIMKFVGTGKGGDPIARELQGQTWAYSGTTVHDCPNVVYMKLQGTEHFNPKTFFEEPEIPWGSNKHHGGGRSVFLAAIRIMRDLGIRRIYLLGCDFRMTSDYTYSFSEQRSSGAVRSNNNSYMRMINYFTQLSFVLGDVDLEIWNCTPQSGLTIFPYMDWREAVERELKDFPDPAKEESWGRYVDNDVKKIQGWQREGIEERKQA